MSMPISMPLNNNFAQAKKKKNQTALMKKAFDLNLKNLHTKKPAAMCTINAENKSKACWQGIKEERTAVTRSTSIGITLQDN